MKIFVTGHKGYIGAHLCDLLKSNGHSVTGCDLNLFEGCEWKTSVSPDKELLKDIRDVNSDDLQGHDCVMHLAAISNDPLGDLDPNLTYHINRDATIHIAKLAKNSGIKKFLFASSCSIYGKGSNMDLCEGDPVAPLTPYAESKIQAENGLLNLADEDFSPVILRNATAYGDSPMLRLDIVVNNLLACAYSRGDIRVMSDGSPWRPLVHCRDIARAFIAFSEAPRARVHAKIVNIGANNENYQVRDVVTIIKDKIPTADVVFTGEVGEDPRNYRVNFDKLSEILPDFKLAYTVKKGVDELYDHFKSNHFSKEDFEGDKFIRLRTLKKRMTDIFTVTGSV